MSRNATITSRLDSKALVSDVPVVVAMGVFDGLHLGHRKLLSEARDDACARGVSLVAVTFSPDPVEVLDAKAHATRLLGDEDRVCGLLQAGADHVLTLAFTPAFASMTPLEFVRNALCAHLMPEVVHVGRNFRFGAQARGNVEELARLGATCGFAVRTHELVAIEGETVSATRVRALLGEGRLDEANGLLGRCHYVRGVVRKGRREGTAFGFPTVNVWCDAHDCLPSIGVYACYVMEGGRAWPAAANVGAPPTFSSPQDAFLEANLLGFEGNLYDAQVAVAFVSWLRSSRKFDSVEELKRVVLGNIEWVRENLGEDAVEVGA